MPGSTGRRRIASGATTDDRGVDRAGHPRRPSLEAELVRHGNWQTRREVEGAPFACINGLHDPRRNHSALGWKSPAAFEQLEGVRAVCPVEDLTLQTHDVGRALAERNGFSICDAMIVASALVAGCRTLWSERMQDGLLVENRLRIVNPFA